jgi:hypothetical protein
MDFIIAGVAKIHVSAAAGFAVHPETAPRLRRGSSLRSQ